MPPLLLSYHKLDPSVSYNHDSVHCLTFTHHILWETAEHFEKHASDPSMDHIAFVFKNIYNKAALIPSYHKSRELVFIDDVLYLRLRSYPKYRELVFINDVLYLRLRKDEISEVREFHGKQQSHGLIDDFGRLVFILRHIGTSIVYRYKANQIIRGHILKH